MPRTTPVPSSPKTQEPDIVPGNGWDSLAPVLNLTTLARIQRLPHPEDSLYLYCFYAKHVLLRRSSAIRANVKFCANGVRWGKDRVRRAREELASIGLIDDLRVRSRDGRRVEKWLVKVHYVPKSTLRDSRSVEAFSTLRDSLGVENLGGGSIEEDGKGKGDKRQEGARGEAGGHPLYHRLFPQGSEHLSSPEFLSAWEDYCRHRANGGSGRWHEGPVKKLLFCRGSNNDHEKPLLQYPPALAARMLLVSVEYGRTGVFDLKDDPKRAPSNGNGGNRFVNRRPEHAAEFAEAVRRKTVTVHH